MTITKGTGYNIVLAIGGLNRFVSTKVQNSTSVLRLKFSAKNPAHRQYVERYRSVYKDSQPHIQAHLVLQTHKTDTKTKRA